MVSQPSSSLLLVAALLVVSLVASSSAFRAHQSPPISQQSSQSSSSSSSPPPAPTTFPPQFYSAYSRIEAQYGQVYNSSGVIYQDQNNLRCRMTGFAGAKTPYYNLDQLAIYRPPNAQVNSAPANLLTLFNFGPYGLPSSKTPLFSCRTAETYFQSTFPFPDTWFKNGATPNVGAFWDVPYGLVFNGSTTITGRQGLRYISPATCRIARLGVIPCATFTVDATNGTPLQFSNARERRPNSYESDYFLQMTFTNLTLGAPDPSVFELPSNWVQLYRNFNNGFNVERPPGTSYSIVAPGSPLKMSIYLRTVPQAGLGVVTVNVFIKPDKNYNCTDCISWSPSSFNFDASNWRTPQTLSINYVKPGAQKLDLAASGGGYDYQMERDNSYYLSFAACEGKTGIMCNSWSMS